MKKYKIILLAVAILSLTGCAVGMLNRFSPTSHFVHPNSNVKILGPVVVEQTGGISLLVPPPLRTSEIDESLYQEALKQHPGADVIVDLVVTTNVRLIPLAYVNIFITNHRLEGFAAKKIVGSQELL